MRRTQEEILERFKQVNDLFGTQREDLIEYMEFEYAKQFLKEDYVAQVERGEKKWEVSTGFEK